MSADAGFFLAVILMFVLFSLALVIQSISESWTVRTWLRKWRARNNTIRNYIDCDGDISIQATLDGLIDQELDMNLWFKYWDYESFFRTDTTLGKIDQQMDRYLSRRFFLADDVVERLTDIEPDIDKLVYKYGS